MEAHQRARKAVKPITKSKDIETFPSKICMMGRLNLENLNRPLGGGNDDDGGTRCADSGVGHTHDSGGANEVLSNIYRNDVSTSCVGSSTAGYKLTDLQTFDIIHSLNSTTASNSSGVMASSVGLAFTSVQWKELERQSMIFKYLTASLPLPPDLLYPLSLNSPAPSSDLTINLLSGGGELCNARCFKNRDPEPGRCKRTDGKKWRCSKDVAPMQKYCERHLHKSRLRSRKPVEVRNNSEVHKKTPLEQGPLPTLEAYSTASHQIPTQNKPHLLFNPIESDRNAGLMEFESPENEWQHLLKKANLDFLANEFSFTRSSNPIFYQNCVETSNPFPCSNFQPHTGVINAWSMDNYKSSKNGNATSWPVSLHQWNLSPSLNLSMGVASGNVLDGETSKFEIEDGLKDSDYYVTDTRWLPFSRGGPLGEALQPLVIGVEGSNPSSTGVEGSNPASPYDSVHTTATTVSSPSGVLPQTLFSHSENSVCNSPAGAAPSLEYAFQWFS
ncbi:growth-regulating factor 7-like isoform X1 [Primulina eburnea]|uniref:growth-regulating factor 7-like isoform X1 n=2 Tax=Primulina eburnea TaxID=1245227 RepID=UPI003C6BF2CE